jgi:hypothetical protein
LGVVALMLMNYPARSKTPQGAAHIALEAAHPLKT